MTATRFARRAIFDRLERSRTIRPYETNAITVAATFGLTLVLLASTGFAFFASTATTDATNAAQRPSTSASSM